MKPVKRVGAVVLAAALAFVMLNVILALRPARPPLLPSPQRELPEAQNGWPLLKEACHLRVDTKADWTQHNYPSPASVADPVILDRLAQNEPALAKVDEALARPDLAISRTDYERMIRGEPFPEWAATRELARLKSQRAFVRAAAGDDAGAMRDARDVCRLGQRLQAAGNPLIGYLVALAVQAIGQRAVQTLTGPKPSANRLDQLDPTREWPLRKLSPNQRRLLADAIAASADESDVLPALGAAMGGELEYQRRALDNMPEMRTTVAGFWRSIPLFYDARDSQRIAEEAVSAMLAEAAKPAWERRPADAAREPRPSLLYNALGRSMLRAMLPAFAKVSDKADGDRFNRRATGTILALRLYADDHGRLPATLDELPTAKLLPAVPLDPFDGKPIRYLPRRGLLYSVYSNHRDDGGVRDEKTDRDDQAVWLPFVVTSADAKASQTAAEAPAAAPK